MAARTGDDAGGRAGAPTGQEADTAARHWAERVRARARELGLTDAEVARRLNLSPTRYANYMSKSREPDLMLFVRLCRALDTTPDSMLAFQAVPEPDSPAGQVLARATSTLRALPPVSLTLAHALLAALAVDAGAHAAMPAQVEVVGSSRGGKPPARKPSGPQQE